jgi:hypothetical protein
MKLFWTKRRTSLTAQRMPRSRLGVEPLEARDVPANHLLIDFTPDAVPNERWQPASFAAAFNLRYANGYAPAFLDFNRDGYVGSADVGPGAIAIANRVAQFLQPFDVRVWYGDTQSNTNLGVQWFNYGQQSADQVFVMYTGGIRQNGNTNILGEAFQPPVGYVNEYYAYTYATSLASYFMNYWSGATPAQFVDKVAQTIAHEFGHLVGIGHVYGNPAGDPNLMNYNSNASTAYIPDAWYQYIQQYDNYRNEYWGWQNPAQEVRTSLRGEPNYANYVRGIYSQSQTPGLQLVTSDEIMGDGHGQHAFDAAAESMPDALARFAPPIRTTTFDDVAFTVPVETALNVDRERRDVAATVPASDLLPVPSLAPELAPESVDGPIVDSLVRGVRTGPGDSYNLMDTSMLDLTFLPGISPEKDEFRVIY